MLLSPKAGGVGLMLTAANHVIHLSRWWNPAVEDQCTDRVYRIGQTKTVQVHIPLAIHPRFAEHSFDRNLHALLERKRELSRGGSGSIGCDGGRYGVAVQYERAGMILRLVHQDPASVSARWSAA